MVVHIDKVASDNWLTDNWSSVEADNWSPVEADNWSPVAADNWSSVEADNWSSVEADNWSPVAADNWSSEEHCTGVDTRGSMLASLTAAAETAAEAVALSKKRLLPEVDAGKRKNSSWKEPPWSWPVGRILQGPCAVYAVFSVQLEPLLGHLLLSGERFLKTEKKEQLRQYVVRFFQFCMRLPCSKSLVVASSSSSFAVRRSNFAPRARNVCVMMASVSCRVDANLASSSARDDIMQTPLSYFLLFCNDNRRFGFFGVSSISSPADIDTVAFPTTVGNE